MQVFSRRLLSRHRTGRFVPINRVMSIKARPKEEAPSDGPKLGFQSGCQGDDSIVVSEVHETPGESTGGSHRSAAVRYPPSQAKGNAPRRRSHQRKSNGAATANASHRVLRSISL